MRPYPALALLFVAACGSLPAAPPRSAAYADLTRLFAEWRAFETPPRVDGAPDYTAPRMAAALEELEVFRGRLEAIDPSTWTVEQQIDWHLVRAELNGFDFHARILQPWVRDPAFYQSVWTYQSDTPAHEGPAHHALLELWTYRFPLDGAEQQRLLGDLRVIPPLLAQARRNLSGNARELWIAGTQNLRDQERDLTRIVELCGPQPGPALSAALDAARAATRAFVDWLEAQAPSKTGPSGIGKENYTWYLRNVHLVPLTW